jgi:hypothetical protein
MDASLTHDSMRWWRNLWFRHFGNVEATDFFAFQKKNGACGRGGWNRASRVLHFGRRKGSPIFPASRKSLPLYSIAA